MRRRESAFIFIGGIQPKKVQVDEQPRICPSCGQPSARLKRLDHYVSLFFIPLFPIKRGGRFMECNRCGAVFDEGGRPQRSPFRERLERTCPSCGKEAESGFKYCPHCGQRMS